MPCFLRLPLAFVVLITLAPVLHAQTTPFTAEDILKVSAISVLDVTDDGRWIAATVRRPSDNETTDHRRYGDPTYLAPARVTLQIIDAQTGDSTRAVRRADQRAGRVMVARRQPTRRAARAGTSRCGRLPVDDALCVEPRQSPRHAR